MARGMASTMPRPLQQTRSIPHLIATGGPSFSFEFFPPKDDEGERTLWEAVRRLERVRPTFVSVTYGAGGGTQDRTVRITGRIARETTLTAMAHLTCVGRSYAQVRQVIGEYAGAGIRHVLALRGDPKGGLGMPWVRHPEGLDHADELVSLIRSLGTFTVGVAAFPDRHPESPSLEHDADVLLRKEQAGAEFAITQMVFDADSYLRLRDRVAQRGSALPILPGIMPVSSYAQLRRMADLAGQPLPDAVTARLAALADDPAGMRAEGVQIATEIGARLLAEGAPGLHLFTLNRSPAALQVYGNVTS